MELSERAKKIITELRCDYEKHECLADVDFLCAIFDIMDKEDGFSDVLSYEIDKHLDEVAYEFDGRVFVDFDKTHKEALNLTKMYKRNIDKEQTIAARNMFIMCIIFHELTHISQEFGFSKYASVNKLFSDFYAHESDFKYSLMRVFLKYSAIDERYANAHTFRLLADIYEDSSLNNVLGDAYFAVIDGNIRKNHFGKWIKGLNIECENLLLLPLLERLDLGFTITSEEAMLVKELKHDIWTDDKSFSQVLRILNSKY